MILRSGTNLSFGEMHFGSAQLGDSRRTRRLAACADTMCRHPGGTLPDKFCSPADLKAFYRLCNCPDVTHQAVLAPHRERTLEIIKQLRRPVLIIHDATELDYTTHQSLSDLGQIGNGNHKGYICQNSLAVDPKKREVLGLVDQVLHHRVNAPKGETTTQRRDRETRESRLWLQGTVRLPTRRQLVDVCDQGADTFEFLQHECYSGRRFVIRSAYDRGIWIGHEETNCRASYVRKYARRLPSLGERTVEVTSKTDSKSPKKRGKKQTYRRKARKATVRVAAAPIQIKPPGGAKTGDYEKVPIEVWVIRVWEVNPPRGQERLEWFLLTNEPIHDFEQACRVIGWYECRWIVEEYHKALKTGCGIENPQFETEERLRPAIALISVVALTLLSLRDASRRPDAKTRSARELISRDYVEVLSLWRHKQIRSDWTVHEFFYALARLGGHQNRRRDKQPGWLVLWRGWTKLQLMLEGAQAAKLMKTCG
jgi:hypothetical protein